MGEKVHYIPEDYQDLYESYFDPSKDSFVRGLTRRYAGKRADDSDVEDLMHAAFERMLRLKSLEKFDATRGNFGLYLQQIVKSTCYNWHTKNGRTPTTEALHLDVLPFARDRRKHGFNTGHRPLRELAGVTAEALNPEEALIAADLEERLFAIAETERAHGSSSTRGEGLGTMISILISGGEAKEAAKALGVSASTITHWRQYLQTQLNA